MICEGCLDQQAPGLGVGLPVRKANKFLCWDEYDMGSLLWCEGVYYGRGEDLNVWGWSEIGR